jgi:hypothetical protein
MKAPATKRQTPKKLQGSMIKVQIQKKLQFPNPKLLRAPLMHCSEIGVWDLFGILNLGFGFS